MSLVKNLIKSVVDDLPDDSTYDEILKELVFVRMVRRGIDDFDQGRTISNEEMQRRIKQWTWTMN